MFFVLLVRLDYQAIFFQTNGVFTAEPIPHAPAETYRLMALLRVTNAAADAGDHA
jgi:hypothetical protein